MEGKSTSSLWALVIFALFGSTFAMLPGAASPTAGVPAAAASTSASLTSQTGKNASNEAGADHTAAAVLAKFFCGHTVKECQAEVQAEKGGFTIDSMIVTVADPIESGLGADFDSMIDTVQRAAEANHLVLDRFDLPWLTSGPSSEDSAGVKIRRDPNLEPGVMLFRSPVQRNPIMGTNENLMIVFIVGETPTGGIHSAAFQSAVSQICAVRSTFKSAAPADNPTIKVLGPAYSGSANSLAFAINDTRATIAANGKACDLGSFKIITGGATSIDPRDLKSDGVSLKATINPDSGTIVALLLALVDQASEVALLSEAGTSYGDITVQGLANPRTPLPSVIRLKFPIHIAEIEKASEQTASSSESSVASILQHPELPLGPSAGTRRDLVPVFSQSDLSTMQLELDNILKVIADRHIQYVVLAATDVDDTVYLAGELHQVNPNATIISLNHNVLYEHNDVNPNLRGMLVASSYPLFVENQPWTSPYGQFLPTQFPTDTAEGAFNAFQALLNQPDKMVEYAVPFDPVSHKPPLWLSVVGRGGVWPVATFSVDDTEDKGGHYTLSAAPDYEPTMPAYQWPTRAASFVGGALLVAAILFMLMMRLAVTRPHSVPAPIAQYFGDSVFEEYRGARRYAQLQAALIAIVVLVVFFLFALMPGRWPGTFPGSTVGSSTGLAAMRVLRATHLDDGVSPITAVLLAAAAALVLMFASIQKRVLLETQQIITPFLAFDTPSFEGVAELERGVRDASEGTLAQSWRWWIAVAVTFVVYYFVVRSWRHPPIDGRVFEILYLIASTLAYLWIATVIFRLVTIWLATRRLLHRMYWHPSRDGYATIHEDMPGEKESRIDLTSALPNMTAVEAGLAFARQIANYEVEDKDKTFTVPKRLEERRGALVGAISGTETSVEGALDFAAKGLWAERIRIERQVEEKLGALSLIVAYIFEPAWRLLGRSMPSGGDAPIKHPPLLQLGEAYVASRVADLLHRVMPQLRTLAVASTAGVLLMLLAASSYPFPASDDLLWFSWGMVVIAVASTTWMFVSINRDRVVSLLSGTTPGSINWNSTFVTQLATHALVPVLVLLGAAFPERLSRIVGWLGGILGGGHGG